LFVSAPIIAEQRLQQLLDTGAPIEQDAEQINCTSRPISLVLRACERGSNAVSLDFLEVV